MVKPVDFMNTKGTHNVFLPSELIKEIDRKRGFLKRSVYIQMLLDGKIERQKVDELTSFLQKTNDNNDDKKNVQGPKVTTPAAQAPSETPAPTTSIPTHADPTTTQAGLMSTTGEDSRRPRGGDDVVAK